MVLSPVSRGLLPSKGKLTARRRVRRTYCENVMPSERATRSIVATSRSVKRMLRWRSSESISPVMREILAVSYHTVNPRDTQIVMISPAPNDRFALLLRDTRTLRDLAQEDVAQALGVDRSLVSQWERGVRKRPVTGEDVGRLVKLFPEVTALRWVISLGFPLSFDGIEDEEGAVVQEAYQAASDETRRIVRLALGVESPRPRDELGRSFRQ